VKVNANSTLSENFRGLFQSVDKQQADTRALASAFVSEFFFGLGNTCKSNFVVCVFQTDQ
jgi:hypothetical protein